jgi:hypothetical protein
MTYHRETWHSCDIEDDEGDRVCTASGERELQKLLALLNPAEAEADDLVGLPIDRDDAIWRAAVNNMARPGDVANLILERDALRAALEMLLDDVESAVDMGKPFSNPENGFHESVMASLRALGRA